ncbi:MAG: flagellar motor protein MotB [Salinisphaeraceae bacterium]|nr:flagellar motor protein MotB [Salinisphaeraceae bacterium]
MLSLRWVFAPTGRADADGDGVPDYKDKCPNTPEGAPVDVDGCPLDSDGDGVLDNLDKCPNTPAGVTVGADGCPLDADADGVPDDRDQCPNTPAGVAVDDTGCPIDSDGDGVPDYKDKCPNTPAGVQVNADGCPLVVDADGDGVPDDQDKCPDTPAGVPVTSDGCAVGQKQILRGVNYEFNKATLTANAERILDQVAQTLRDSPGFVVELAGHTDSKGSDSYNQDLSQRRAEAAMAYLITAGIDASRLRARGYGESQPIEPNTTPSGADNPEGRAANRRTEFRVIGRQ